VVVASITTGINEYAAEVFEQLKKEGIRAEIDLRNEKISYKIREHSLKKVPYVLVVGQKEAENRTVAVRVLGGEAQEIVPLSEIIERIKTVSIMPV
jgi:threonyl-tRNA synthetase